MGQKILLIDDSAILRRIATNVLGARPGQCEVVTATRVTEGFAQACRSGADLILVDFQIAGPPDAELCQRLLNEPRTAHVPVILLLGRGMKPPALDTLPENVVSTLIKPFTPEQLVSAVDTVCETSKGGASFRVIRERFRPEVSAPPPPLTDHLAVSATLAPVSADKAPVSRVQEVPSNPRDSGNAASSVRTGSSRAPTGVASLRSAFQTAAQEKATGVLRVSLRGLSPVEVYFDGGHVVVVTTRDASLYSEEAADVLPAKVSPAMLESAVEEQAENGVPFLLQLGVRGLLSKAAAVGLLHQFGQRHFARLWTLRPTDREVAFEPLEALPGFAMRLDPRRESVEEWLLGSLRHLQAEDVAALMRHEGCVGTASYRRGAVSLAQSLKLTDEERDFTKAIDGRRDLPTVAKTLGMPGEQVFLLLYRFRCLEIMDYRPTPSAFVVTPRTNVRRVLPLSR